MSGPPVTMPDEHICWCLGFQGVEVNVDLFDACFQNHGSVWKLRLHVHGYQVYKHKLCLYIRQVLKQRIEAHGPVV